MQSRAEFLQDCTAKNHLDRALALLWYYRETQQFEERTASELANDLHEDGFAKPNITRLAEGFRRTKFVVRGRRKASVQLNARHLTDLDQRYAQLLKTRSIVVQREFVPMEWVTGTRAYLERIVYQTNSSYELGLYDCAGVMCRRLMESLIIDVYVNSKRHHEIQSNGVFVSLDRLVSHIRADKSLALGRSTPKTMSDTKALGDTAAHDRVYITEQSDLDDLKARYRKMIKELLGVSGTKQI